MKVTDTRRNKHKQTECDFILQKVSLHAAYKNNRGVARPAIQLNTGVMAVENTEGVNKIHSNRFSMKQIKPD